MNYRILRHPYGVLVSSHGTYEIYKIDVEPAEKIHFGLVHELGIRCVNDEIEPSDTNELGKFVDAFLARCNGQFEMTREAKLHLEIVGLLKEDLDAAFDKKPEAQEEKERRQRRLATLIEEAKTIKMSLPES